MSVTGDVAAADAAAWVEACGQLLDRRIRAERDARYRQVAKHTRAIETMLRKSTSVPRKAAAIRTYLRTLPPRERGDMIGLRMIPALLADSRSGPELIRGLLRRTREQQRLWRQRLAGCPDVVSTITPSRAVLDASKSVLQQWQREFESIWRRAVRRCEYAPDCDVPGGRYFIGRSKECPTCRARHSRVTGYRHRRKRSE